MDVENEYPPREFYYPEDLETRNLRDWNRYIGESQEAIDDFVNRQKSVQTQIIKKTATDLNTLLQ